VKLLALIVWSAFLGGAITGVLLVIAFLLPLGVRP